MSAPDPRRSRAYAALHMKAIRRALVLAGIGAAVIAAAVMMAETDEDGFRVSVRSLAPAASADPLAAEFARCNGLGTAAADDASCRAAWAESRRRFLGAPARSVKTLAGASATAAPVVPPRLETGQPGSR